MVYPKNRKLRRGGMFGSPEYYAWQNMIQRCYNSQHPSWETYGKRGITVCDDWIVGQGELDGFDCFLRDMGSRPSAKHTLDRENNDLEYSKRNCQWVTRKEQSANRRNTVWVDFRGERMPLANAARLVGIVTPKQASIRVRALGWSAERAVTTPIGVK